MNSHMVGPNVHQGFGDALSREFFFKWSTCREQNSQSTSLSILLILQSFGGYITFILLVIGW